eukprot:138014-Chlamydomonas_euryale.AAC.7
MAQHSAEPPLGRKPGRSMPWVRISTAQRCAPCRVAAPLAPGQSGSGSDRMRRIRAKTSLARRVGMATWFAILG